MEGEGGRRKTKKEDIKQGEGKEKKEIRNRQENKEKDEREYEVEQ